MTTATVVTEVSRAPENPEPVPGPPDRPSPTTCQVKLGCSAPVVDCAVSGHGGKDGSGGCPQAGGVCIGCTVPGFPDAFLPLRDDPTAHGTPSAPPRPYGAVVRRLRGIVAAQRSERHPSRTRGADRD
jgi:hydrogenase small subunit